MDKILNLVEAETDGKCYKSYRYCADEELRIPTVSYEDSQTFTICKERYGETDTTLKNTKNLTTFSKKLESQKPLFQFFLDGSRRTYKIDDIEINRRIFPIMAGQLGVACCQRKSSSSLCQYQIILKFCAFKDTPENAIKLSGLCEYVFMFDEPYNSDILKYDFPKNVIRVNSWNDIYRYLKSLS